MNIPFISSPGTLTINVQDEKPSYAPGDKITGTVSLRGGGGRARSLTITLECCEFVNVQCGSGKHRRKSMEWVTVFEKQVVLGGEGDYSDCVRNFEFVIPMDAPPTIRQNPVDVQKQGAGLRWVLHAKLDIPWGQDANAEKAIFVK